MKYIFIVRLQLNDPLRNIVLRFRSPRLPFPYAHIIPLRNPTFTDIFHTENKKSPENPEIFNLYIIVRRSAASYLIKLIFHLAVNKVAQLLCAHIGVFLVFHYPYYP